ncbi:uncharacterized protein LOC112904584 [Agrilus planipennis]|uniref:Uncharacterized protein LOC112904584 n=1 Tax=Agrilus planipennis TaxID=224129 RepID=A0A7F5R4D2_AGRPL|nr:uncharacterized protein LOC112904584 [Agrilus planipennis]
MKKEMFLLVTVLVLYVPYSENSIIRFPSMPNLDLFLDKIANTTIDVVTGVTGVVNGGVSIVTNTILRIINGAGTATEKIINLLEEFRKRMVMGIPELGIPILEPLTIEFIDLNITHEVGRFVGYARDIEVRHLSRFKLDHISLNLQNRLSFNITFPYLKVIGFYEINGNVGDMFRIFGKGPFWLKLQGLSISAVAQLRFNMKHNPSYYLEWLKIKVKLQKIQVKFHFLLVLVLFLNK